jgi:predicted DNA-binding transcriptional regulator AlpA
MIRRLYLPIGERTLFRMMAIGTFPKADVRIGGKLRLWRRATIEQWIATQVDAER